MKLNQHHLVQWVRCYRLHFHLHHQHHHHLRPNNLALDRLYSNLHYCLDQQFQFQQYYQQMSSFWGRSQVIHYCLTFN